VKLHEIPWQAYLEIQHHYIPDALHCGGVLVDADVVLTAAHCVTGVNITLTVLCKPTVMNCVSNNDALRCTTSL
jgi:secreted trypsin-like serine protease